MKPVKAMSAPMYSLMLVLVTLVMVEARKPCIDSSGVSHPSGSSFNEDCNSCTCHNGRAGCTLIGCPQREVTEGKPCIDSLGVNHPSGSSFNEDCNGCTCHNGRALCTMKGCSQSRLPKAVSCGGAWNLTYAGSCYAYVANKESWLDAGSMCRNLGGHLVEISDQHENRFIKSILFDHRQDVWLGASDLIHEGSWFWSTSGRSLDLYWDWGSGEPDNDYNQDCLEFRWKTGKWNDHFCSRRKTFICEKKLEI